MYIIFCFCSFFVVCFSFVLVSAYKRYRVSRGPPVVAFKRICCAEVEGFTSRWRYTLVGFELVVDFGDEVSILVRFYRLLRNTEMVANETLRENI